MNSKGRSSDRLTSGQTSVAFGPDEPQSRQTVEGPIADDGPSCSAGLVPGQDPACPPPPSPPANTPHFSKERYYLVRAWL